MKRALLLIAASAAVYAAASCWAITRLPDDGVAMHVNTAGQVNSSTTRSGAITYFVGLGGTLMLLAVTLTWLCAWVPISKLNIPHKDYWTTPERAPIVRRMVVWDASLFLSMMLLVLSCIPVNVALASVDPAGSSGAWIIVPIGGCVIAMVGYVSWMITRRAPRAADPRNRL